LWLSIGVLVQQNFVGKGVSKRMFNIKKRLVLLFSLILYSSMFSLGIVNPVSADILGAYGLLGDGAGKYCADTKSPWHYELKLVSECRTGANKYVPHNGYYTYRVTLLDANTQAVVATYDQTPSMYLNAKDWINHQGDWQLSGPLVSLNISTGFAVIWWIIKTVQCMP